MKKMWLPAIGMLLCSLSALASESSFERTLSVNGSPDLTISTGSGEIRLTRGSDTQIHIVGHVHSSWGASEDQVRAIVANPPIEQTGNIVRVGTQPMHLHNISIDYDVQAPAGTHLDASTGSGELHDEGVGRNSRLSTGSGDIRANGLQGSFTIHTGSGSIVASQLSAGDVRAQTGSGDIDLQNIRGSLSAQTGSGNIRVTGTPAASWRLQSGSGSIDATPGSSGFMLDASTGSGTVRTDQDITMQGSLNRHHVTGSVHGGGPLVHIQTGSGDIHIH